MVGSLKVVLLRNIHFDKKHSLVYFYCTFQYYTKFVIYSAALIHFQIRCSIMLPP